MEMVCYRLWKWYVTAYGNGMLPLMEMVCYRLWKWKGTVRTTIYGNGKGLFKQPLYSTSASYTTQYATALGNRLSKWKGTVWATAYRNGSKLFGQPL
jgi:hypothetical protein